MSSSPKVFRAIIGLSPRSEQPCRWFGSRISHRDSIATAVIAKGSEYVRGGDPAHLDLIARFYHWLEQWHAVPELGRVGEGKRTTL